MSFGLLEMSFGTLEMSFWLLEMSFCFSEMSFDFFGMSFGILEQSLGLFEYISISILPFLARYMSVYGVNNTKQLEKHAKSEFLGLRK